MNNIFETGEVWIVLPVLLGLTVMLILKIMSSKIDAKHNEVTHI
ncbi:hypothetical protein SPONL_1912 [uncultured Candidatus Thioglobus sp.]|nr:hypothetical protein SPONL_1912 [uncultured Candidatus Thioglobus sp.]